MTKGVFSGVKCTRNPIWLPAEQVPSLVPSSCLSSVSSRVGGGLVTGVGVDTGGVEGAAQAPSKIILIARTDNNFLVLI